MPELKIEVVGFKVPEGLNLILGKSHFIKTVEDLHEALVNSVPGIKFGIAFCEASGDTLIRHSGNDDELVKEAVKLAEKISGGHEFVILLKNAYPVNVLRALRDTPELVTFHCATANPVDIVIGETEQGRCILGVIDGYKSKGVEDEEKIRERKEFLRKIGYKL